MAAQQSSVRRPRRAATQPMPLDPSAPYSTVEAIARHRGPMTVNQLAPLLGVSRDGLYRMVNNGKIPRMMVPGSSLIRFDPASVCHWLRRHNPILNQIARTG